MKKIATKLFVLFALFTAASSFATTHHVMVSNFAFTPANLNVAVGDSIMWMWANGGHTTTSSVIPAGAAPWDAVIAQAGDMFIYKVTVPGVYEYVCTPHAPTMAGSFTATGSAGGSDLLVENFNYTAGDSLGAHGWVSFSGGATNTLSIVAPGLTYPGYPLSGIGNAAKLTRTGQDAYKSFTAGDSVGSTYGAFMVKCDSATATGDYFFAFLPTNSTTFFSGRVFVRSSGAGFQFGIEKGAASDPEVWGTTVYNFGTTYIVVLKYTFVAGATNDLVSLYAFSSGVPATEPGTPEIAPSSFPSGDANNIGRIALRQGGAATGPVLVVDGIRAAKNWGGIVTSVNPVSNTVADGFKLEQNYPNPFNPTTNIKFTLPTSGLATVKVYDMMGREVATLVNGNMTAGVYTVDFNGSSLSSGVYFYKINFAGSNGNNYSDTKKLMLVK